MSHILNINAIRRKMTGSPKLWKMYGFFDGATSYMDVKQIKEMRKIVSEESKKTIAFLDKAAKKKTA